MEDIVRHDQKQKLIVKHWVVDTMEQMQLLGIQLNVQHEHIVKRDHVVVQNVQNQRRP